MGTVYKAHDRMLDETVALKVLRAEIARTPEMVRRFRSEIKLARKVRHRNVCGIHEYGEDGPLHFISMEFVDGTDFQHLVREKGPLPVEEAFTVAMQAADGLEAIHDVGIIHRDLKTANIVRDSRGVVRLMDFGIAKQWAGEGAGTATVVGTIIGTPEYMSPEQGQGLKVDFRTDVYSLGIVVFELFTGRVPFRGDTPVATIFRHIQDPPPLDGPEAGRIPQSLRTVLRNALAKSPEQRYGTAQAMVEGLRQARDQARQSASVSSSTSQMGSPEDQAQPLNREDWEAAGDALRRIAAAWAMEPLVAALKDPGAEPAMRCSAAETLGRARERRAVEPLTEALRDGYYDLRLAAAEALGKIRDQRAVEGLLDALKTDGDRAVRWVAAEALGRIGRPWAVEGLVSALKDEDRRVRLAAAQALDALGWEPPDDGRRALRAVARGEWDKVADLGVAAMEPLQRALTDEDRAVRLGAVDAFKKLGDGVLDLLLAVLKDGGADPRARCRAAEALGRVRASRAVEPLQLALSSSNAELRAAAAAALGEVGDLRAVEALVAALKDSNPKVRLSTAAALADIGEHLVRKAPRAPDGHSV